MFETTRLFAPVAFCQCRDLGLTEKVNIFTAEGIASGHPVASEQSGVILPCKVFCRTVSGLTKDAKWCGATVHYKGGSVGISMYFTKDRY